MTASRAEHAALVTAQRARLQAHPEITSLGAAWQPLGPAQVRSLSYGTLSGRITSIAIDPGDASGSTVYLGAAGGGVWKSTNAAASPGVVQFTALTDSLAVFSGNADSAATASLSIGALSAQTGGIVLAGTGDPNDSSDSYYGSGILRSADGGQTWALIPGSRDGLYGNHSFVGLGFAGFAWSTATPGLVVAAVSQSVEGSLVNAPDTTNSVMGLYVSTDAGVTWQMATIADGSQILQSPLPNGGNNGGHAVTAVVWNPVRQRFYAAVRYHGYYESADGVSWTRLATQPSASLSTTACPPAIGLAGDASCPIFRGALAVDPVTGDTFALTVDAQNRDLGIARDVCGLNRGSHCQTAEPAFTDAIVSTALETTDGSGTVDQGDYNLVLAAVPDAGDTVLFAGTHDLFRCSVAAGCVLRNTTNTADGCNAPAHVAPAQHAIAASNASGSALPMVFFGNDGGLWRSTDLVGQQASICSADDAAHFQNLNGSLGSLAEVISFAQDPVSPSALLAGLGAAGTAAEESGGWLQLSSGEGGTVAIDPVHPSLWYLSTAAGISILQCADGDACSPADAAGAPTIGSQTVGLDDARLDAPWLLDPDDPTELLAGTCRVWRGPAGDGAGWVAGDAISSFFAGPTGGACDVTANPLVRSLAAGGTAVTSTVAPVVYAGISGLLSGGGTIAGHIFRTLDAADATSATVWTDLAASPVTNDASNQQRFNPGGFDISSITVDSHDRTGQTVYATVMGFAGNGVSSPHLYRSIDGGAHWLNVSGNLPNAPANSVAVDPNDANTVYVALDTGVYVTQTIGTCAAANCWTVLGTALPNAPVIQLAAAPQMPTGDGRLGELRASTAGRGIWQIPLLTALTPVQPAISLNADALVFPAQAVGTLSATESISLTNSGSAALVVSSVSATGDFQAASDCTGSGVAPGASCVVQAQFLPSTTGARSGVLTIFANVSGGQATIALSGAATAAAPVVLNPVVLPFPSTPVSGASAAENITVSNTGTASTTLGAPSVSGDFLIAANTCGATLGAGTGCTVSLVFAPQATGSRTGLFRIAAGATILSAALSGSATSPPTDALSATQLSFGSEASGSASAPQTVLLTNAGDVPLTLISASITAGDFSVSNSCGNSLSGHASCAVSVVFAPTRTGAQTGSMVVADEFRSQTVLLSGTGIAPTGVSLSPQNSLSFPATAVGATSAVQTVTLTNHGGGPLSLSGVSVTGDFALAAGSSCSGVVAAGTTCSVSLLFAPATTGTRTGTLTIADDAANSPQVLVLSGSGVDFAVSADGQSAATIASGASAAFPMLVTAGAGVSGTASITCSGAPANSSCNLSPASVSLAGTQLVVATVSTGVAPAASASMLAGRHLVWTAFGLPLVLLGWRRRIGLPRRLLVWFALFGGVAGSLSGCAVSRDTPSSGVGGDSSSGAAATTPPGTYTIQVTVASAGVSRQINFTLTVQ